MAYINDTLRDAGLVDRLTQKMNDLGERFAKYQVYRETYNELAKLSERELNDIGLTRGSIRAVAYETAYQG